MDSNMKLNINKSLIKRIFIMVFVVASNTKSLSVAAFVFTLSVIPKLPAAIMAARAPHNTPLNFIAFSSLHYFKYGPSFAPSAPLKSAFLT